MTQIKLWQIVGQTPNTIIFADANGNLTTIAAGGANQMLVISSDGTPVWVNNNALATALEAKTDASSALATAKAYTEAQIAALVDHAPIALNTLNELAVKLNGEDSAINALLLQVDGKAEKTEVATLITQAKQDVLADSHAYADNAVGSALPGITNQIADAKGDAISTANDFTTQSVAQGVSAASDDATAKANTAKASAVTEANAYSDGALATGLSNLATDVQNKIDVAKTAAIDTAAQDATSKVANLKVSIVTDYTVESTSTACYVAPSTGMDANRAANEGVIVAEAFVEVTGATVSLNDTSLNAKLLFVNGIAVATDWQAIKTDDGRLVIKFSLPLAQKVFDGSTVNTIMLLAEYKNYNAITLKA